MALAPQESRLAGWSFLLGTALFSGSLYVCTNFNPSQILPASPAVTNKNILAGARVDSSQEVGNDHPLRRYRLRCGLGRLVLSRVPRKRVSLSRFLAKETKHITILCYSFIVVWLLLICWWQGLGYNDMLIVYRRLFNFIWLPPLPSTLCQNIATNRHEERSIFAALLTTKGQSYSTLLLGLYPSSNKPSSPLHMAGLQRCRIFLAFFLSFCISTSGTYVHLFFFKATYLKLKKNFKNPFSGLGMLHQRPQ